MKPIVILLVDNSLDDALMFTRAVKGTGISARIVHVQTADAALDALHAGLQPQLYVLDENLPDRSGSDLYGLISDAGTPAFAYTGAPDLVQDGRRVICKPPSDGMVRMALNVARLAKSAIAFGLTAAV